MSRDTCSSSLQGNVYKIISMRYATVILKKAFIEVGLGWYLETKIPKLSQQFPY